MATGDTHGGIGRCGRWLTAALLAVGSTTAAEAERQPAVGGRLVPPVESKLKEAFPLARERVRESPSCRKLFEDLGKNGSCSLAVSRYLAATSREEQQVCRRRASAFTRVGSPQTRLCRSFSRLGVEQAARVLIHEALHYAGMRERPAYPEALGSAEINHLVTRSCGL